MKIRYFFYIESSGGRSVEKGITRNVCYRFYTGLYLIKEIHHFYCR